MNANRPEISEYAVESQVRERDRRGEEQARLTEFDNRQLRDELLPAYRRMRDHFARNMSLAESSTRSHFPELVKYIEMWDRHLDESLPRDSAEAHQEEALHPFYEDLETQLARLSGLVNR